MSTEETDDRKVIPSPIRLALIIDNEVLDIIGLPDRLAAILLSNPTIIEVTDYPTVSVGDQYDPDNEEFTRTTVTKLIKEEGFNA